MHTSCRRPNHGQVVEGCPAVPTDVLEIHAPGRGLLEDADVFGVVVEDDQWAWRVLGYLEEAVTEAGHIVGAERVVEVEERPVGGKVRDRIPGQYFTVRMLAETVGGRSSDLGIELEPDDPLPGVVREPVVEHTASPAADVHEHLVGANAPVEDSGHRDVVRVGVWLPFTAGPPPTAVQRTAVAKVDQCVASAATGVHERLDPGRDRAV